MAVASMTGQMIEMETILGLAPANPVDRGALEAATMEVEQVLEQHALGITEGASASANFETETIEIDVVLRGETMSELYQKVALIVTQLDRHCNSMRVAPLTPGAADLPAMAVQGSQMRRLTPDPDALVHA
jgi:hypothetical protein